MPLIPASSFRSRTPSTGNTRHLLGSALILKVPAPLFLSAVLQGAAQWRLRTDGAEKDARVGSRQDGLEADAVAAAFPKILSSLVGNALGDRHGTDPSGLRGDRSVSWGQSDRGHVSNGSAEGVPLLG